MADGMIAAAPAGQPATVLTGQGTSDGGQTPAAPAAEQSQSQVSYVTNEQLNAAVDEIKRLVQSSTDKSYSRVQKMIKSMQQAGIQNPTEAQARAMLAMQDGGSESQEAQPEAQPEAKSVLSPEAEAWVRQNGGDVTQGFWEDIYDAAKEAGVSMITREDPEYAKFFLKDGQMINFEKPRAFVRAFENAFAEKKTRLSQQEPAQNSGNLASSPALGGGGVKSNFHDPKTTNRTDLITYGLRNERR